MSEEPKVIIVVSKPDIASMLQFEILRDSFGFVETGEVLFSNSIYARDNVRIVQINEPSILSTEVQSLEGDLLIFASKHVSQAGMKAVLVHTPGVWTDDVSHGGIPYKISLAPANELKYGFDRLVFHAQDNRLDDFNVGIEVTHHGPILPEIPAIYVEQGGTKEEWQHQEAAETVAATIYDIAQAFSAQAIPRKKAIVGFGGNHYCARFLKLVATEDYAFGHIIPKHVLDRTRPGMIHEAWARTLAQEKIVVVDKKGTKSAHRNMIREQLAPITEIVFR